MKKFIDPFLYNAPQLDIHGFDRYGAVAMVKNFIDNCVRIDSKKIVIVHGKGTGKLREGIHKFLKTNSHVKSFRIGTFGEGEMGVTVVELK